jgi:hypothetical protein
MRRRPSESRGDELRRGPRTAARLHRLLQASFVLEVAEPTPIGLSDTFVGGFVTTISPKMNTWT